MATRKSIWILIGMIVIMAWVFGSVTQAGTQTYTLKCRETGHSVQVHAIEVGDMPGHMVYVGENAGVQSCEDGSIRTTSSKYTTDITKGSGISQGYSLATHEDGSTLWDKYQVSITPPTEGKTAMWEATGEFTKGTGQFEGIQGGRTFTGKRIGPPGAGAQYYTDSIITYTLPSK